ncbi:MFS transporter [Pseudoduganella ginsengisoli]|uniref:MFS transporter n=1 Tax=Pseudoduganella ginsengisoli TaxID=1462440 RepID=A0A6L6Q863_9BURK|nr:MFS transporter [Pseudoduganella ginsengisoli]MTW05686.1 MFS transporter [Pseudoduganella ginsengisoli]
MAIAAGTPEFTRSTRAMFLGGFSTFALLYCVQPLMPVLGHEYALTAAQSSLVLAVSTAALALSLVVSTVVSARLGRTPLMVGAMAVAAVMTLLSPLTHSYGQLVALRAALGMALGGMPAIAMVYLSEEMEATSLGAAMGVYISGGAFGGMAGRMLASVLGDLYSWRVAMAVLGAAGLYAAWEFWRSLPRSRHFTGGTIQWRSAWQGWSLHLRDDGMRALFALAFVLMGCMVSVYSYIAFRLQGAPYGLSQSVTGLVSFLYVLGIFSSVWAGKLVDRLGRRNVLWKIMALMLGGLLLTLFSWLPLIVLGMAVFTFAFFAGHSIASSWVGRRALALSRPQAGLASGLYLFFYYLGSSVVAWTAGLLWPHAGWAGVVGLLGACLCGGVLIALRLRQLEPVVEAAPAAA